MPIAPKPLNFDEDSADKDGEDAFAMKFDKRSNGGSSRHSSSDDSVP